jgi:hypothetical protein
MSKVSLASQADYAKSSYQATIASMALEAQKLNLAGDMIIMDPSRHYVLMVGANQDPETSIIFDLLNRVVYNITVAPPAKPEDTSSESEIRMMKLEQRVRALENLS